MTLTLTLTRYAAALLRVTNRFDFATLAHVALACSLELGGRIIGALPPRRPPELHQLCPNPNPNPNPNPSPNANPNPNPNPN